MIDSCILEHRSNYYFDLSQAWGFPPCPYTCHTLFVSHSLMGTILIKKPKATMPQPRKHHLSLENPMMSIGHKMSSFPHTLGRNMLTQKIPQWAIHNLHHPKTSISLPSFDPHTLAKAQKHEKGLKISLKRAKIALIGAKTSKRCLKPIKGA